MNNKFWEPETQDDSLRGLNDLRHSERSEESQYNVSKLVSKEVSKKTSPRQYERGNLKFPSLFKGRLGWVCRTKTPYTSSLRLVRGKSLRNDEVFPLQWERGKINKLDCFAFARNDRKFLLTYLPTNFLTCKRAAFTLAEMMVVLLIMTIVLAAGAPMMTTRYKKDTTQPWKWQSAGSPHTYFGQLQSQIAMIGKNTAPTGQEQNAKLIIDSQLNDHILFESNGVILGRLRYQNNGILLGNLINNGNLGNESIALGKDIVPGTQNITIGNRIINNGTNGILLGNAMLGGEGWSEISANSSQPIGIGHMVQIDGSNTVAIGTEANAFGNNTIAIGSGATTKPIGANPANSAATAIGSGAKAYARNSIAIGNAIVDNHTSLTENGNASIAIGEGAKADYDYAVAIGRQAQATNNHAVAIGKNVMVPASRTVAIGSEINSKGSSNILIGSYKDANFADDYGDAGYLQSGRNIFIGENDLHHGDYTTASNNIALGYQALSQLTTGNNNIAIGKAALYQNNVGGANIAIGPDALVSNMSGTSNIAIGNGALESNVSSSSNIAIGTNSLSKTGKSGNVALGENACQHVTGSNKVCIGTNSGPVNDTIKEATDDVERIFIGSTPKSFATNPNSNDSADSDAGKNAVVEIVNVQGSNKLSTGGAGSSSNRANYIDGPVVYINGNLVVRGYIWSYIADDRADEPDAFSLIMGDNTNVSDFSLKGLLRAKDAPTVSDRRLKDVGKEFTAGLDKIRELKTFHYTFKKDEKKTPHVGIIAQDLQKVFPDAVSKGKDGFLRIRMEDMFYAVVNAIKELDAKVAELFKLQDRVNKLEKENAELKKTNTEILKRLEALEKRVK